MSTLTTRELEVLEHVADGLTAGQIGQQLHLSRETVRSHLKTLRYKLGAADRAHAVALAVVSGELVLPTSRQEWTSPPEPSKTAPGRSLC